MCDHGSSSSCRGSSRGTVSPGLFLSPSRAEQHTPLSCCFPQLSLALELLSLALELLSLALELLSLALELPSLALELPSLALELLSLALELLSLALELPRDTQGRPRQGMLIPLIPPLGYPSSSVHDQPHRTVNKQWKGKDWLEQLLENQWEVKRAEPQVQDVHSSTLGELICLE
ncbi:hypothetical protein HGM15179_016063 [Zosterops borbonicus]|uniref:Uncharacterized protein n=1 Tax=Zosterops borbonicus TaxID=364589 RepID=A0A8K1G3W0_9PASS|nr:hypothetical protein HGM15179_016063 [Zosterops borbonicus]